MDFELTEEQKIIQETSRNFALKELEPVAKNLDHEKDRDLFLTNIKKLAQLGFTGLNIKNKYGGSEAGIVASSVAITEIAKACASTAVTLSVNNMVCEIIESIGSEEQKMKYIPKICSGEYTAAGFALTEPGAGSDAAGISTSAVLDKDEWVINGRKIFVTSASYSSLFVVVAVTDKNAPRGKGISCFLVETGIPGLIIGKEEHKMGQRGSATNEVIFENCRVPKNALIGKMNEGLHAILAELSVGRLNIASLALGIGLAAMDYATKYAMERTQFGQKISNFQAIQWMIADSYTELEAARLLIMNSAFKKEHSKPFIKESSMAKLFASEAANRACYAAIQILGGYGYTNDFPIERYARDARITSIYEGTSEIQRIVIFREILKNFQT
jgi:alkylation response protein AidB-like acyl-CoA dehydrogenase